MYERGFPVSKVTIIFNTDKRRALMISEKLRYMLTSSGISIVDDHREADVAIVIGGDGTILRAFHQIGSLPILGIKDGTFGTMLEIDQDELSRVPDMLSSGDFWLEFAKTLELREPEPHLLALNEFLIRSGKLGKSSRLGLAVDYAPVSECICDGIIVATQTGSYAYSLAAGGPVLDPRCDDVVISYVAPWPPSLAPSLRSLVVPSSSIIEIWSVSPYLYVIADGLSPVKMRPPLRISGSDRRAVFVRKSRDPADFYRRLTRRMLPKALTGILRYPKLKL